MFLEGRGGVSLARTFCFFLLSLSLSWTSIIGKTILLLSSLSLSLCLNGSSSIIINTINRDFSYNKTRLKMHLLFSLVLGKEEGGGGYH